MADPSDPWDDDTDDASEAYDDGHDTFAALDFTAPGHDTEHPDGQDDDAETPLFTVANPDETVAVTTFLNGTVQRVDLDAAVTRMTERQLADEVLVMADLARQKAQAVLHTFVTQSMSRFGHDTASLSAGLTRDIGMPTRELAAEAMSRVFLQRYSNDTD